MEKADSKRLPLHDSSSLSTEDFILSTKFAL